MKHPLGRAIAAALFAVALLVLWAAILSLPPQRARAESSAYGLYVNGTLAPFCEETLLSDEENGAYYLKQASNGYVLTFREDLLHDCANICAGIGAADVPVSYLHPYGYGWDFGTQTGSFEIAVAYDYLGARREEKVSVYAMRETQTEGVWYSSDGWRAEDGSFTGGSGDGALTLLFQNQTDMVLTAEAEVHASVNGEERILNNGSPLSIPAADTPTVIRLTYTGGGTAVIRLSESRPVFLYLDYDERLGMVTAADGTQIAAGGHRFEKGTPLELSFSAYVSVSSSLRPEETVSCVLDGFTVGGEEGTGDGYAFTIAQDTSMTVRFRESLPSLPTGGTVCFRTADGTQTRTFTDGALLTLTDASGIAVLLPAPDVGEDCSVTCNGEVLPLTVQNGRYRCEVTATEAQEYTLLFTLSREGYLPARLSLTLRICASVESISLCDDNKYERI